MTACSFSEMLSSYQDGLTEIEQNSLYSFVCLKIYVGVYKTAAYDTVQCNNAAQGTRKISFNKKIELEN